MTTWLRAHSAPALLACFLWASFVHAEDAPETQTFSTAQLEELVAPIALYPDTLLAQVFVASTYPLEVVDAARWQKKNASLTGDALDEALGGQSWDDSVRWLVYLPDVLQKMSENLDWTKDLGDAFLGQKADLMDAVQRMRAKAYDAGNLKTSEQQVVVKEVVKEKEIIRVEPASTDVVYVPSYAPAVYGPTYAPPPQPYYYQSWWATPAGAMTTGLLTFGAGMATGALISGAFDWHSHDVYCHNWGGGRWNRNVNVNINRNQFYGRGGGNRNRWQHRAEHRRGVRYRNDRVARDYGGRRPGRPGRGDGMGWPDRPGRGDGIGRPDRPGRGDGIGGRPDRPGRGQVSTRPAKRPDRAQAKADRMRPGGRQGAFRESGDRRTAQRASQRGAASRGARSYAAPARSPQRGIGGGGRGGGGHRGGGGGKRGGGRRR